jgi:hypothetical protein
LLKLERHPTSREVTLQPNKKRDDASARRSPKRWEVGRAYKMDVSDEVRKVCSLHFTSMTSLPRPEVDVEEQVGAFYL